MGKKILGYNITLKIGERVFAATTSNSFDITPNVKESQTKDDEGTKIKRYQVMNTVLELMPWLS